jgi:hypothetical protein
MKVVNFFTHFILQLKNLIKNKLFSDLHKYQKYIENRISNTSKSRILYKQNNHFFLLPSYEREELGEK